MSHHVYISNLSLQHWLNAQFHFFYSYMKAAISEPLGIVFVLSTCHCLPGGFARLNSHVCYIAAHLGHLSKFFPKIYPKHPKLTSFYSRTHTIFIFGGQLRSKTLEPDPLNSNPNQLFELRWVTSFCFRFLIYKTEFLTLVPTVEGR